MTRTARQAIDAYADAHEIDLLVADGFDEAIVGICERMNEVFVVYDRSKVLAVLRRDMTYHEAQEYFDFNVAGAWVGDTTPGFLLRWKEIEEG
jgi:hypothetical protein